MEKDRERAPRGAKRTRKKVCQFCADRVEKIDYKDTAKLRKCMTERSKITMTQAIIIKHSVSYYCLYSIFNILREKFFQVHFVITFNSGK